MFCGLPPFGNLLSGAIGNISIALVNHNKKLFAVSAKHQHNQYGTYTNYKCKLFFANHIVLTTQIDLMHTMAVSIFKHKIDWNQNISKR